MSKELTLEAAVKQIEDLTAKVISKETEIEDLKAKLKEAATENSKLSKEVPGTFDYPGKNKAFAGTYKFKKGVLSFNLKGTKHISAEALENKDVMIELIEIGAGVIEKVEPSK